MDTNAPNTRKQILMQETCPFVEQVGELVIATARLLILK
jgi:hypothetical protein